MTIALNVHLCSQRRDIKVTFATDAQAAAYVRSHADRCVISFLNEENYNTCSEELAEAMYPTCEHGMSARLCAGPMHWMDAEQERALDIGVYDLAHVV